MRFPASLSRWKDLYSNTLPPSGAPTKKKDIESLEKVQRRASRLALKQKSGEMSYEDRCRLLNWQTLEKRRECLSLVQCYNIIFGIESLPFSDFFELTKFNRTRANHDYKLYLDFSLCIYNVLDSRFTFSFFYFGGILYIGFTSRYPLSRDIL